MADPWSNTWNLCDLPACYIGSLDFNERPQRFELQAIHATSGWLRTQLDAVADPDERTHYFN